MRRALPLLLLSAWPHVAAADSGMLMGGVANRRMVLDPPLTAPSAAYSFRLLRSAYTANKAVNIVRASDSTTTDVGFTASGDFDTSTASTFCNATTCKVVTWYDQSGNSRNITNATDAQRPTLNFSCLGARPCMQLTTTPQALISAANFTPATGVASFLTVSAKAAGTGVCQFIRQNGSNNLIYDETNATFVLRGSGAGGISTAVQNTSFHGAQGTLNGASSAITIDGTTTTGTATGNTTAGTIAFSGAASTTCNTVEGAFIDNYAMTAGERQFLYVNQRAFWRF